MIGPRTPASPTAVRATRIGVALCMVVGAVLRYRALWTDFSQDEIWSLTLVQGLASPLDVLTRIHHDNNHVLNSLFLYLLGDRADWTTYRLFAFGCGVAAIALAAWIAAEDGGLAAVTASLLFAVSFLFVTYSSEARGYAPAVAFALAAFALHASDRPPSRGRLLLFWLAVCLGFLSHLSFAFVYYALVLWTLQRARATPRELARWHAVPMLFVAVLLAVDVVHLQLGGSAQSLSVRESLAQLASVPLGLPDDAAGVTIGLAAAGVAAGAMLREMRRRRDPERVFFAVVLVVPLGVVVAAGLVLHVWFLRYTLVAIAFLYVLVARFLARLFDRGLGGRVVYVAWLIVFVAGNGWRVERLLGTPGRGHYRAALVHMARASPGDRVTIAGNHDASLGMTIGFYARYVPAKHITYERGDAPAPEPPRWYVVATPSGLERPARILDVHGERYLLDRRYDCFASCYFWYVYRHAEATDGGDGRSAGG